MLNSKIISFFLCLLLLIQVLPLQQIGKALSQSQWTEELPHGDDCASKGCYIDCFNNHFITPHPFIEITNDHVADINLSYIHSSESIPQNHCGDIESPPPDLFA